MASALDTLIGITNGADLSAHTADTGQAWASVNESEVTGVIATSTGPYAVGATGSAGAYTLAFTPASADYGGTVKVFNTAGGAQLGVILRRTSGPTFYLGRYIFGTGWQIYRRSGGVGGTYTQIGTTTAGTVPVAGDVIGFSAAGAGPVALTVTLNGVAQITTSDTASVLTATGLGGVWSVANGQWNRFTLADASSPPTAFALTGPSAGRPAVASSNFTATLNQPATASTTITLSDGGAGGTFSGAIVIAVGQTTGTCTYTASSVGAKTISATSSPALTAPANLTFTAYSLAVSPGSQSVGSSTAASLTATLTGGTGTLAATTTAGTLSTAAPVSGTAFTVTVPSGSGTVTVTVTHAASGATATATVSYAPAAATALTLTGPATAPVGAASTAYTVGGNGTFGASYTVTPASSVAGDTFTPATVTVSSGSPTATFTLTSIAAGARTITVSTAGLTPPAGVVTTASVVVLVWTSTLMVSPAGAVGYTLRNADGTVYQARTTAGVVLLQAGVYGADVTVPGAWNGSVVWDDTGTGLSVGAIDLRP